VRTHKTFPLFGGTRENAAVERIVSAAKVHVALLGGFSVTVNGQPVPDRWRLRKAKTLVKLLALAPKHRLHRDVVSDRLWPDAELEAAANNLYQIMFAIRHMLGSASITLNEDVLGLCPVGDLTVDVDQFVQAAAAARSSSEISALRQTLDLWTGPLLPEDRYADWADQHREQLSETHAAVASLLGSKLIEQGEPAAALAVLEPLAAERPLDEHVHRVLIDALADLGRRWEAIESYERLRNTLDEAYAAEPEPQTKAVYRRLLTGGKPMRATTLHNLAESTTSFVGRRRLLAELSASLARTRLLTLTGVGGVGKSRLALELARLAGAGNDFPDGIWLIELAGIQDPEVVASTVASALHITLRSGSPPMTALAEQLASRSLLLIMDNCETCWTLAAPSFRRCSPGVPESVSSPQVGNLFPFPASSSTGYLRLSCLAAVRSTYASCPGWKQCSCSWNARGLRCPRSSSTARQRRRSRRFAIALTAYHSLSSSRPLASPISP